jgi:hypothetical protein
MKGLILACVAAVLAGVTLALAGSAWSTSESLVGGTVTVSNGQANSSWVPVAVLIQYAGPSSGTVDVRRVSQGLNVVLGVCVITNVTSVVWVPDGPYPFACGEALVIGSSETNGLLQLIRRGE